MRKKTLCKKCGFFQDISCICGLELKKDDGTRQNVYAGSTDDKFYKKYDHGAGRKWSGYAENRDYIKRKNWERM